MSIKDKPLAWLVEKVSTPPFSPEARGEAGFLLRKLQQGDLLSMPESRPMPSIGRNCHELRIVDKALGKTWRLIYAIEPDAIVLLEVFDKKTQKTPDWAIKNSKSRLKRYYKDVGR